MRRMIPDDFVDVLKETGAWEDKSLRARNRDARSEDETVRKPRLVDCIADLRIALSSRGYETTAQSALHSTVSYVQDSQDICNMWLLLV